MFQPAPFSLIGKERRNKAKDATIETQTKTPDGLAPKTNLKIQPMRETRTSCLAVYVEGSHIILSSYHHLHECMIDLKQ
jgi:hypothetical protein